jgi:hypothetical protein
MRKLMMILGTILIATILISGSAVAVENYIIYVHSSNNCTNPTNAIGSPDGSYASIGVSGSPPQLGWIILDFDLGTSMDPDQDFTVYGTSGSGENESYLVSVWNQLMTIHTNVGTGYDLTNHVFTTPSTGGQSWRYVQINGTSGSTGGDDGDTIYGPEIDAVGYDP